MNMLRIIQTLTHVLLTIVIILFILTGLGITNYQIIEPLTLGALSKLTSYQIHSNLLIPLLILLGAHFVCVIRKKYQNNIHQ
jgi:hypothetical protein